MTNNNKLHKLILTATGLFTLLCGLLVFLHPQAVFPDAAWGFQVLRGMHMGGSFNLLPKPNMADIAKNNPSFLSWWSPGQYLVSGVFIGLFKATLGRSVAITATLCSFTGLAGLYRFFKKVGFSSLIAAISIAFITSQLAFAVPFVFYNGGEVLLFAFTGWFLYGCTYFEKAGWQLVVLIFISGIAGFFCKSSFLWIYFSGCLYLWIRLSYPKKINSWIINGLCIGIAAILSLMVIYAAYMSKGENPASDALGIKLTWETFTFPMAGPLLAGFSVDDLTGGLIYHTGPAPFNPLWTIILLLLCAVISLVLIASIIRYSPSSDYKLLLVVFYIVSVLFFGISFLRQSNISYEARHLRVIGLIVIPGIVYLLSKIKISYRIIFGLLWVFIACSSFKYLYKGNHRNAYETAHSSSGIAQPLIDQTTLNDIHLLDEQQRNAIFVFISPDLGLEITHNRIITLNPVNDDLNTDNIYTYEGHAGPIYIVLPQTYVGAKAAIYLQSFPGYANFTMNKPGKGYVIYSAK